MYDGERVQMDNVTKNIMLVDDDESILMFLDLALQGEGVNVESYSDPIEALDQLRSRKFHLLISDYMMADVNGVQLLDFARQLQPACVRLLFSGNNSAEMLKGAINNAHIYKFIEKPVDPNELLRDVEQALEYQSRLECGFAK